MVLVILLRNYLRNPDPTTISSYHRYSMSLEWISHPISCQGLIASNAIRPNELLLPLRTEIAFRAYVLYHAWQAHACDGRQMSQDDFDRMEDFKTRFDDASLNEDSFRHLLEDFGNFIPRFLTQRPVDVPERALHRTRRDANKMLHESGKVDRF